MSTPQSYSGLFHALFTALHRHQVRYAVFGAMALAFHGLPRATADVDLWVEPEEGNIERLKDALRSVFRDPALEEISPQELCGPYPAVRYGPPAGFPLDIVTRLGTVTWSDLEVEEIIWQGIPVPVVSARTLWRLKNNTVRQQDRYDAAVLAQRFGFRDDDAGS